MYYIRTTEIGRRGYKYVGGFETKWQAVAHSILMYPHEIVSDNRVEQWSDEQIKYSKVEGENKFVRADRRQIDKYWVDNGGIPHAINFASEEAQTFCGVVEEESRFGPGAR